MKLTAKRKRVLDTLRKLQDNSSIGLVPLAQITDKIPDQTDDAIRMMLKDLEEQGLVERPISGGYRISPPGTLALQEDVLCGQ